MAKQSAQLRYLRMAPRKVRAVAGLIRGLSANEAEAQLIVQKRRPAETLLKLLRSCIANAKQSGKLDLEKLYVESIQIDGGPMLRRFLPRARGKADPIQKKSSHITLVLGERAEKQRNRFTILPREKKKTKTGNEARAKKRSQKVEENKRDTNKPGFFRKIFNRKSV